MSTSWRGEGKRSPKEGFSQWKTGFLGNFSNSWWNVSVRTKRLDKQTQQTDTVIHPATLLAWPQCKPKDVRSIRAWWNWVNNQVSIFASTHVSICMKWKQKKWGQPPSSNYKLNNFFDMYSGLSNVKLKYRSQSRRGALFPLPSWPSRGSW